MKKYLFVFVCLAVFAVPLSAQTGDAIFTQTYSNADLETGFQSAFIADDFVPVFSGDVKFVVLWMVYTAGQPASIFLKISQDDGSVNPNTATYVAGGLSVASHVDTGDDLFGQDVIKTTCTFSSAGTLSTGNTYWLEVGIPASSYWCVQQPLVFGSTMWIYNQGQFVSTQVHLGKDYDTFFELRTSVAIERNTWGNIKASF
ncbi:MAG: hypothetical protein GQ565_11325 [Candidatus Aegiribacteria sp.]|nr:hypothetical protein [Candidatus Aegiribacteria sp.]